MNDFLRLVNKPNRKDS